MSREEELNKKLEEAIDLIHMQEKEIIELTDENRVLKGRINEVKNILKD